MHLQRLNVTICQKAHYKGSRLLIDSPPPALAFRIYISYFFSCRRASNIQYKSSRPLGVVLFAHSAEELAKVAVLNHRHAPSGDGGSLFEGPLHFGLGESITARHQVLTQPLTTKRTTQITYRPRDEWLSGRGACPSGRA